MIYPIVAYGHLVLTKKAKEIAQDGEIDVKQLSQDMFETMYNANGVGLAAPQIGLGIRMFVVDAEPMDEENLVGFKKVFINAQIIEESGKEWSYEEGCLSLPGLRADILRKDRVHIRYYDENWQLHEETYEGLAARVIQHEYDHIDGILFIDHLSPFKRKLLQGKLGDIQKGNVKHDYKMKFVSK
jgi:peptide deformylase